MNAEALVGKKLGSYTLRRVIGVGSMGAVYLARQSQSHHEFVLKVFLHASSLEPLQYIDFLLRFRQEMELVAALKHPHILSVLECEERNGFVYLVMPYVSVRNLESVLHSQKVLALSEIADYLDQLAAALDYAHEQGVLHLDIKPSNILVTTDNKLLFTDFALTKTMNERQAARIRQFKVGMLDYMAPEQVMGKDPGEKTDLYSLGAVLYHLVTGSAPFHGVSMVEVAKKHLQDPPPSPRSKRTDLPHAAEQVILRALSKPPGRRYDHALNLATAFRLALETPTTELEQSRNDVQLSSDLTSSGIYPAYSLFDPHWSTDFNAGDEREQASSQSTSVLAAVSSTTTTGVSVSVKNLPLPPNHESVAEKSSHPLHVVHFNPITSAQDSGALPEHSINPTGVLTIPNAITPVQDILVFPEHNTTQNAVLTVSDATTPIQETRAFTEQNTNHITALTVPDVVTEVQNTRVFPEQSTNPSGALTVPESEQGTTGTIMKLSSPAKIVNVPVAGQPGRFLVGILPVQDISQPVLPGKTDYLKKNSKIIGLALLVIFLLGTGALWFAHQLSSSKTPAAVTIVKTPDLKATTVAQATETAEANIILADPLTQNIHNWPIMQSKSMIYIFKDKAYHITNNDDTQGAPAILSGLILQGPFVYSLTMEEIKGDDTSVNNEYGMIFRANVQNKSGKTYTTFYSLEVLNKTGGEYQFWKYDDSQGSGASYWKKLASHPFGGEFHEGQGTKSINTFKIIANGKNFSLVVNGKQVWIFQDGSFATGGVGMLVNLKGTEVAFSNLLLTHT